jgi:phenylpropionate dioxygenase-like ring-hydroxylating dioxygenase large terminal subunit
MDKSARQPGSTAQGFPHWAAGDVTRIPYWIYQDSAVYRREQERIFEGPVWNFLCLEAELPEGGSFVCSNVGEMPVLVTRDEAGQIHAFENRCVHRGALISYRPHGQVREFACVYHNWTYDLSGNLTGVAFGKGIRGQGGMPEAFRMQDHRPRPLRIEVYHGLVFGSLSAQTPHVEAYLGPKVAEHLKRVMRAPVRVLGGYSQMLPSNWKLYMENVKDTYHASLLHLFFARFRLNRLSQEGGLIVDESGANHVSFTTMAGAETGSEYEDAGMRSASGALSLEAPEILRTRDEFGDGITLQILAVTPAFVLQQIRNSLAVRRLVPRGPGETELVWTAFGYCNDTEEMTAMRLRQANLIGPAGFISMEDGAATGFVQRGVAAAPGEASIVEMGGHSIASSDSRVSEAAIRGFWANYRRLMDL